MKKYTLLLLLLSATVGCNKSKLATRQSLIKDNVIAYAKTRLDDPDSFEFVDLMLRDSTTFQDNINYEVKELRYSIKSDKERLSRESEYKRTLPSIYDPKSVSKLKSDIYSNTQILSDISNAEKKLGKKVNEVASYKYLFSFRCKNGFGAKVLNQYIIQTGPGPEYNIINMVNDQDKVYLNPGQFPGYKEIVAKYYKK